MVRRALLTENHGMIMTCIEVSWSPPSAHIHIVYRVHHLTKPQELNLEMLYIYCIHEESVLIFLQSLIWHEADVGCFEKIKQQTVFFSFSFHILSKADARHPCGMH